MGAHPKPKSEKIAAGTYRKDRDKSATFDLDDADLEPPADLGDSGRAFWMDAYRQPWITPADQYQVANVARQIERQEILQVISAEKPEDFRLQRAQKELDRSIESGLGELLLTPHARRRVGVEIQKTPEKMNRKQALLATMGGEISWEEFKEVADGEEKEREYLKRARLASARTIALLADPDGIANSQLRPASPE